jgi:hypothetical protein
LEVLEDENEDLEVLRNEKVMFEQLYGDATTYNKGDAKSFVDISSELAPETSVSPISASYEKASDHMRAAAIMLAQLDPKSKRGVKSAIPVEAANLIRNRIVQEMAILEEKRLNELSSQTFEISNEQPEIDINLASEDPSGKFCVYILL